LDARSQIVLGLREWEEARRDSAERRSAELDEQDEQLFGLLIRARDAGLRNSEIAAALNGRPDSGWWTTQAVTREMSIAEQLAAKAVDRLIEDGGIIES
jgi:hypothetical protein